RRINGLITNGLAAGHTVLRARDTTLPGSRPRPARPRRPRVTDARSTRGALRPPEPERSGGLALSPGALVGRGRRRGPLHCAPGHGHDANVLADALDPGAQAADAADVEIDPDAGLRRPVERLDAAPVGERVELHHDSRRPAGLVRRDRLLDLVEDPLAEVRRG